MPKALIFDFDGVIVLSEEARFYALQGIARRYGAEVNQSHFHELIGTTTRNFLNKYFGDLPTGVHEQIQHDFNVEFKDKIIDHVTPIAATYDFIKNYRGSIPIAVASGSDVKVLTTLLMHLGISDRFQFVFGKEHVTDHKPHPAIYLLAAQHLGLEPADCTVIEDSVSGATAAIGAGMPVYIFLNGINDRAQFADLAVSGFISERAELDRLLV